MERKVLSLISKSSKVGVSFKSICKKLNLQKKDYKLLRQCLKNLLFKELIIEDRNLFFSVKDLKLKKAEILKVNKTYGFARTISDNQEIFIPGKFLQGSLPGDIVLVKMQKSSKKTIEGVVKKILEKSRANFIGKIVRENSTFKVLSDYVGSMPLKIKNEKDFKFNVDDKVLFEVSKRGPKHSMHVVFVIINYGKMDDAASCCESELDISGVKRYFDKEVLDEVDKLTHTKVRYEEYNSREILTNDLIFTIDSEDSKDLDDAISLEKINDIYYLGVHIADVGYYVKYKSSIDEEAFRRGTSIYYADSVIPMLPKDISNGLCSLNPNEDKLTFSVIMQIDKNGNLLGYTLKKTVINSVVKGIYSEINKILENKSDEYINNKYANIKDVLFDMKQLADILYNDRKRRGSPEIETTESKILIDKSGKVVDVTLKKRGISEKIIEEFMIIANKAVACFAKDNELPFVYRIHEYPSTDKIEYLNEVIKNIGVDIPCVKSDASPKYLSDILESCRGKSYFNIINKQVLRSMSKAKYSYEPIGHYGLVLEDYCHFTSPIRRYPDLVIHRILSDFISGKPVKKINDRYKNFVVEASNNSSKMELNAVKIERKCEDFYKAEYMKSRIGEDFEGVISGVTYNSIYVEIQNTVEGVIRIEDMPKGDYKYDGFIEYKDFISGKSYKVGDKVNVKCVKTSIMSGKVYFELL